jgi:SAM-dependent methyltransferase
MSGLQQVPGELDANPDRLKWNERYRSGPAPSFPVRPVATLALASPLPAGPVLELACGPSGSALLAAVAGRKVTAVDASEVALALLAAEARRRQLAERITLVPADLTRWQPPAESYALVLCTGYFDRRAFAAAAAAVAPGGVIGWEAFTDAARLDRPKLPAEWCLGPGEPASLLPPGFVVRSQQDIGPEPSGRRRLLAVRRSTVRAPS